MMAELAKGRMTYDIVDAIDGRSIDLGDRRVIDPAVDATIRPGMAGCVLSHLEAYRRVIESSADAALILEDDVLLPPDLGPLADAVARQMTGAEVALLNFHLYNACLTEQAAVALPGGRRLVRVTRQGAPWSGAAYVITREACVNLVDRMHPVRARADYWALFYTEGSVDRVRCVVPMPVGNSVMLRSTKDNFRPGSVQTRALDAVARLKVPVLYQFLAWRRWRHLRRYKDGPAQFVPEQPVGAEPLPIFWRDAAREVSS
jgi:GR25 family glycosyltransferase involved in LPS biosynthesis